MPVLRELYDKTKKLLIKEQTNILKTSFSLMVVIMITKLSGFLTSSLISNRVGLSREWDLFILANTIPEMLGNLLLVGLASAVFVPIFVKAKNCKDHQKFTRVFNSLLNMSLLGFVAVATVFAIFSHQIFPFLLNTFVHSEFAFSGLDLNRAADMMRLLLVPQIFLGLGAYYTGGLNAHHRFIIPQFAPFFYNIGRILGAYFLIPAWGIEGLVYGTIIGSFMHFAIQIPLGLKVGIRHSLKINLKDKDVIESIRIGVPRMLGLAGEQVALIANRLIASRFVQGSVSAYTLAVQMIGIPLSLFGVTFSIASFPLMAKAYQEGDNDKFMKLFMGTVHQILFLAVPVTGILMVLRLPLVRLLYGTFGGSFVWEDTVITAWVILFFSFGLVFESLRTIIYRAFYAVGDTVRPLRVLKVTIFFGVTTSILFANYFSNFNQFDIGHLVWDPSYFINPSNGYAAVGGSALSSSITYILEFFLLLILFNKYVIPLEVKKLSRAIFKKLLAGTLMVLVMLPIFRMWGDGAYQEKTASLFILTSLTTLLGMISYLIFSYLLRVKEFTLFTSLAKKISPTSIKQFLNYMDEQL